MFRTAIVVMQFMISAHAGLVNYVEGPLNVQLHQQVPAGMPIQTGPQSHTEILLNPGSFLRLDQNTTVVFDSIELTNIELRVITGAVLIESAELDKQTPIHVTTGNLKTVILSSGMYRFSGDTASVIDGKLRTADSSITINIPPLSGDYMMTVVGGAQTDLAFRPPIVGISPGDCKNMREFDLDYAFSASLGFDVMKTTAAISPRLSCSRATDAG